MDGLTYEKDFLSEQEEINITDFLHTIEWDITLQRRTQHYGYKYDYHIKNKLVDTVPIPDELQYVVERLHDKYQVRFNQLIVNEYEPGQGISPHIDNMVLFDDTVISISLGSSCIMKFTKGDETHDVLLERRSLVCLQGDARKKWKHSIPARKRDNDIERMVRISLTFRKTKE
jgi:alkylated DNA repair dioxygenase AlkB